VIQYLYSLPELNLTAPTNVTHGDNHIINIELAPPPKAQGLAYLEAVEAALQYGVKTARTAAAASASGPGGFNATVSEEIVGKLAALPVPPARRAAVIISEGAGNPPRVYQVQQCREFHCLGFCCYYTS
jgi:hypothetical protein